MRDIFEDNEIFRVIKGATIRASVEPHRARSQSVQPNGVFQYGSTGAQKRSYGYSEAEDLLRAQKRQRIVTNDPDRPMRSREHVTVDREVQHSEGHAREATVIQDSQDNTTKDWVGRVVNGVGQGFTKYGQMNSAQPRGSGLDDRRPSNPVATPSAPLQRIQTPATANSSKDEAATSDSDVHLPRSRATSRSKRKLNLIEDSSEQDRGQSTSTAMTTPLSVLQQSNHQSPVIDKKLRRPTVRAGKNNTDDQQLTRPPPRQNVYEIIETDSERPSAKLAPQDISSKLSSSYKWKRYSSSTTTNSEQTSPRRRRSAVIKEKDVQTPEEGRMNHEDQQALEQEQNQGIKVAKQQAEQERSRLAFEVAEKRRLDAEEKAKELQAKLESERVAAEKLRQEIEAKKAQAQAEAEAEAMREKDALAKAEAAKAAQLAEKAKLEAEAKARLEEQRKARLEEEERARKASEADKQNLKASLEATVRRAATTSAKAVAAHNDYSAAEATSEADDIGPPSNAGPATSSNKQITCTPFIPRGRPSGFTPATLRPSQATASSLPRVPSPNVGLEDQMPMPPQLKRKVSFVDQDPPSGRRSSNASSTLKQTTLVPSRLGITDLKSTPKRTPLKANSKGSKPSKGALFSFPPNILLECI